MEEPLKGTGKGVKPKLDKDGLAPGLDMDNYSDDEDDEGQSFHGVLSFVSLFHLSVLIVVLVLVFRLSFFLSVAFAFVFGSAFVFVFAAYIRTFASLSSLSSS